MHSLRITSLTPSLLSPCTKSEKQPSYICVLGASVLTDCLFGPCGHGLCLNIKNGFYCYCDVGYKGKTCSIGMYMYIYKGYFIYYLGRIIYFYVKKGYFLSHICFPYEIKSRSFLFWKWKIVFSFKFYLKLLVDNCKLRLLIACIFQNNFLSIKFVNRKCFSEKIKTTPFKRK
jgi:hypothetical protein